MNHHLLGQLQGRLGRSNPYDSPRVLRAVLDVICEKLVVEVQGSLSLTPQVDQELQYIADVMCACVQWRGSPLRKLISIDCRMKPDGTNEILFTLRPLSEDGRWLLQQMGLVEAPKVQLPKAIVTPKDETVKITRIVEI